MKDALRMCARLAVLHKQASLFPALPECPPDPAMAGGAERSRQGPDDRPVAEASVTWGQVRR